MCIGVDAGSQEVPEPICPIDITFVSLDPTRIPISSPDITINGPIFIEPIPVAFEGDLFAVGDGLAPGMGVFISIFC